MNKNLLLAEGNASIREKGYTFDIGPTFLMMKFILEQVFEEAGTNIDKELKVSQLDPMYTLFFKDLSLEITSDHEKMKQQLKQYFPGADKGYDRFLKTEKNRFEKMYPCLQRDYSSFLNLFNFDLLRALLCSR